MTLSPADADTNFDNITNFGLYKSYDWSSLANFPQGAWYVGTLKVEPGVDENWRKQIYSDINSKIWVRIFNINTTGEHPWKEISTV